MDVTLRLSRKHIIVYYIIVYQTQTNKLDRVYGCDTEMSRGNPFLMDAKGVNPFCQTMFTKIVIPSYIVIGNVSNE